MNKNIQVLTTTSELLFSDHWDHFLARWGYKRNAHRVKPGLYKLGNPESSSPVFVTANYTLSFDALRKALKGIDGYILVLETEGVNVWCAAGKGTFGTDELVNRITSTQLMNVVDHREIILPQLGAPGIAAHEVKQKSGFRVIYGPVRADDIPEFLKDGKETSEKMRKAEFPIWERLVLAPMEMVHLFWPLVLIWVVFGLLGQTGIAIGLSTALLSGSLLFPLLLPWLPGKDFGFKGFVLGLLISLIFIMWHLTRSGIESVNTLWLQVIFYLTALPPIVAYLGLNFTGSSTYTSRTGVKQEIFRYAPIMAISAGLAIIDLIIYLILSF